MRITDAFVVLLTASVVGCDGPPEDKNLEGDDPGECEDGADNDADGDFDCDDEDCAGAPVCGDTNDTDNRTGSDTGEPTTTESQLSIGDQLSDLDFMDAQGETVWLSSTHSTLLLLDVTAMWSAPAQDLAFEASTIQQTYAASGFSWFTVVRENVEGFDPDAEDLTLWTDGFNLTFPVVSDPKDWTDGVVVNGTFPAVLLLDDTLTVVARIEPASAHTVDAAIASQLGIR